MAVIQTWCDNCGRWVDEITVIRGRLGGGYWCQGCRNEVVGDPERLYRRCGICGSSAQIRKDGRGLVAHRRNVKGRVLACDGARQAVLL